MTHLEALKEIAGHDVGEKGTSGDDAMRFIYLARDALKSEEKDWPALVRQLKYALDARQIMGSGYDPVWGSSAQLDRMRSASERVSEAWRALGVRIV